MRTDFPEHPEVWPELCGWYSFGPGALTDPQPRMMLGAGVEVVVRHNHLVIRGQTPIPAVRRGLRLYPDGDDPYAFRLDASALGPGTSRIVFSGGGQVQVDALHLGLMPMSLQNRPAVRNPRPWFDGALVAAATAARFTHCAAMRRSQPHRERRLRAELVSKPPAAASAAHRPRRPMGRGR